MLTLDMFVLLVLLGTVSALDPSKTFHFTKYPRLFRRNEVACQVCYGEFDCLSLDSGRCGYNIEAAAVLKEVDEKPIVNDALKMRVDSMMYDLLLEDSIKEYKECVPIISSYRQCNKENICTGCKTCDCDERGRWNCIVIQKCSSKTAHVDHRLLGLVMDSLKMDHNGARSKRSIEASEESSTQSIYENLAQWMYVSKPIQVKLINDTTTEVTSTRSAFETFTIDQDNNNNLAFDEILSNDDLAHFIQSSEKDISNMKADNNDSQHFLQFLKNIEEGQDVADSIDNTHLKLDLLNDLKVYFKEENLNGKESSNSSKDQPNSINSIIIDTEDFDLDKHQLDENFAAHSLIRNARHVNATATNNETATLKNDTKNKTHSQSKEELNHIIDVVSVLISNQRKEIVHLNYVKDNLLKFITKYKFNVSSTDALHKNNDLGDNRKHDWKDNMLMFYLSNLNKDIKTILKDIYALEKLRKLGVVPEAGRVSNIKPLLLVLSSYYLKNKKGNRQNESVIPTFSVNNTKHVTSALKTLPANPTPDSEPKPQRRVFDPNSDNPYKVKILKRALTRMLLIIDNDRLSASAINALSPSTKHIFNRIVIKQYFTDLAGLTIRDSHLNLTNILSTLAQLWKKTEVDVFKFNPADRLYNMKLLYFTFEKGIDKIKEALVWIKFGLSRRMSFIEEDIGKDLVDDATKFLTNVDNRVKFYVLDTKKTYKLGPKIMKDQQTESVWHHIKNAFSKSKNGITKYFKGKFRPRSYIVNENVKKRVEEMNKLKFLDVMRRWQEHFDEFPTRSKRSLKQYAIRMKNIIPKYLRGKVNSGLGPKDKHRAKVENRGQSTTKTSMTTTKKYKHGAVSMHTITKKL